MDNLATMMEVGRVCEEVVLVCQRQSVAVLYRFGLFLSLGGFICCEFFKADLHTHIQLSVACDDNELCLHAMTLGNSQTEA